MTTAVCRSVALAIALSAGASAASAADVQFDPSVEVGGEYSDNYTLEQPSDGEIEVSGAFAEASLLVRGEAPRSKWHIEPRVRTKVFPDEEQLESTDYFLLLGAERLNERNTFGLSVDYYDQDIVDSQLPDADFGDADLGEGSGPDSGRIVGANRQMLLHAMPYAEFQLNERIDLRLDAKFQDVSFDREIPNAQESYQSLLFAALLSREFTQASRFGLRLDHEKIEPDAGANEATLTGAQLQWDYRIAERVSAYGRGGMKRSEFEGAGAVPGTRRTLTETTPLFAAGMRWTFLKSELFLDLQRQVDANSSGFVVQRDDVRVFYNHRFSTRFIGYLGAYAISDESVTAAGQYVPRDYYTVAAGLEWRVRKSLSVRGEIDTSYQEFSGEAESADGTSARVSVVYQPRRAD